MGNYTKAPSTPTLVLAASIAFLGWYLMGCLVLALISMTGAVEFSWIGGLGVALAGAVIKLMFAGGK